MKQFTTSVPALPPANFIANPVLAMKNQPLYIVPEFIRLPKPGTQEPFTGLSRAKLNELVLPTKKNDFKPLVRSISLRKVGEKFGVRLIVLESLLSYPRARRVGQTPVYRVDTSSIKIKAIETTGENPGWISRHCARLISATEIEISGGLVTVTVDATQELVSNNRTFVLDTTNRHWSRV